MTAFGASTATLPVVAPSTTIPLRLAPHLWAGVVLFIAFTAPGWAAAFGAPAAAGAGVIACAGVAVVAARVIRAPRWRALPWTALTFAGWAGASLAWSRWPETSALTWTLLAATTLVAIALAAMLTWRQLVSALAWALAAVMALSVVFEAWAALVVGGPVGIEFAAADADTARSDIWTSGQLFTGGRLDGIVGNANLLAMLALLAVVVLSIRLAIEERRRGLFGVTLAVSAYLLVRTESATAFIATIALTVALLILLAARMARTTRGRVRVYLAAAAVIAMTASLAWLMRRGILSFLGRDGDLTDRTEIWDLVFSRGAAQPVVGNGFATPWIPWDPAFADWIVMPRGLHIIQAHSVWVDVWFQLGVVGVGLLAGMYALFVWRTWVFAVRQHRWQRRDDRVTATVSLLPVAVGVIVVIQGVTESSPLLLWGWMLTVLFLAKLQPPNRASQIGSSRHARREPEPDFV
ncbi:O-antigen ligase family protein [Microbacterium sp. NPDC076895]|uniref:O-antigen ligase family protein n=1 Tax=Microbacterium sp. NPDC076895 TaxID=3154957 RepID=UPI003432128A